MVNTKHKQTTIAKEVSLKGVGLHTGKEVTLTFIPSDVNNGYSFKRIDLEGNPIIEATANNVSRSEERRGRERV